MSAKTDKSRAREGYLRVGVAAKILGLHPQTIRRWEREGKLACIRVGPRNERRFARADVERLRRGDVTRRVALYLRASGSAGQETSLASQERELRRATRGIVGKGKVLVFKDRASGLDERRRGLGRLRAAAARGEIDQVWVTHEDRLTRFGLGFLRAELEGHGVIVEILHEREGSSPEQEMVDDFMKLLACFSGRVYGQRSAAARKRLLARVS
jgi:excisionase family DNA binding protein